MIKFILIVGDSCYARRNPSPSAPEVNNAVETRPQPLAHRLLQAADSAFVGREAELDILRSLLRDDGPLVVHLHGLAGLGKSTLLEMFAGEVGGGGGEALVMDCRVMEPTSRGFVAEMGRLTGDSMETLDDAVGFLASIPSPVVLGLDHYESILLLDSWLRQRFLPAVPETTRLVIASRQPPVPRWLASPRWQGLFRALSVGPLDPATSVSLLATFGVDRAEAERLAATARGNPLALQLAASMARSAHPVALGDVAVQEVTPQLAELFLADVADPRLREAIWATSVTRRITRSLLRCLSLDDGLYDDLRRLPFVDSRRDGLRVHDAVREALAHTLRAEDPVRHAECRRLAWRQLHTDLQRVSLADLWRYTADMLYLIENPVIREAFFPSGHPALAVEPARPDDWTAIGEIIRRHEGSRAEAAMVHWWAATPESFHVVRDGHDEVVAFYCLQELSCVPSVVLEEDPVAAAWCAHVAAHPVPERGKVVLLRRWLDRDAGDGPSPGQAACWLDIKRTYMELRPALRRVYLAVVDLPSYGPVASTLGFAALPDCEVEMNGTVCRSALLDFGPASVDGWLTRLVGAELGMTRSDLLDRDRRTLKLRGEEIALTPLEFGLAAYLEDRAGETVTRDELLDQVWGHVDGSGSSNVVDAVVKSLRRKLADRSEVVETVRGHGYRWCYDGLP